MMSSSWKYHGVKQWGLDGKVPYGTLRYSVFIPSLKKRKEDEKRCLYIFILSRTTKTQVDHDNKTTVARRRDAKLAAITLVRSWGHIIRATRSHNLQEAILTNQGAPSDHSEISARRTNWIQLIRLNSVGPTHPPLRQQNFALWFVYS